MNSLHFPATPSLPGLIREQHRKSYDQSGERKQREGGGEEERK
jgi:hypothetical protein